MGDWNEAVLVNQGTVEITEEQTVCKKKAMATPKNKKLPFFVISTEGRNLAFSVYYKISHAVRDDSVRLFTGASGFIFVP